MLPTQNTLEIENFKKFNFQDVEKALYNYFENKLTDISLSFNLKLQVLTVDCNLDYSEYEITYKDYTDYGTNKPIFMDYIELSNNEIKKLLSK